MKKLFFAVAALSILALTSCKRENYNTAPQLTNTGNAKLGIDIQSSFDQDRVQVLIDGKTAINRKLTTNHVLGVCWLDGQITSWLNPGQHEIKVIINNFVRKTDTFSLGDSLFIGVCYLEESKKILLNYSDKKFMYD